MKIIDRIGAQGDALFRRVDSLPKDAVLKEQGPNIVVAHSETGHHHVAESNNTMMLFASADPLVTYLKISDPHADVTHHRSWDTHETMRLYSQDQPEVIWEIRRQRETTPEGFRRVED